MTDPRYDQLTPAGLHNLAASFAGQESVGVLAGVLLRLARFLGGDPGLVLAVPVTNAGAVALPDYVPALSAVFTVTGAAVQYRMDGTAPQASDPVLQPGAIVTLTGRPSFLAFRAIATTATPATLAGAYYT